MRACRSSLAHIEFNRSVFCILHSGFKFAEMEMSKSSKMVSVNILLINVHQRTRPIRSSPIVRVLPWQPRDRVEHDKSSSTDPERVDRYNSAIAIESDVCGRNGMKVKIECSQKSMYTSSNN